MEFESQLKNEDQEAPDHGKIGHAIGLIGLPFLEDDFKKALDLHFSALAAKHNVDNYTIIYLLDRQDSLSSWHADRIYTAASYASSSRPILLVLDSHGGWLLNQQNLQAINTRPICCGNSSQSQVCCDPTLIRC